MSSELLRVLLVDDHPLVRNGLRALLASVPGMMVVGEATSGEEAILSSSPPMVSPPSLSTPTSCL